jgi:transposase
VSDLPLGGLPVVLHIHARKFFCRTPSCPRRIFTERLPEFVAPHARRSQGLRAALHRVALATGGEAGARLATALAMPTSLATLLRLIRSVPLATPAELHTIGVDEWAWRKGVRYGTMIVDLERHRVAALLPDRDADQVAAWLATHPTITIVSRDRSSIYTDAVTRGAPQAIQVADRFHLLCNVGEALEKFLLHKRAQLKEAAQATATALAPPPIAPAAAEETYPGKHTSTRPQLWQQRAEEASRTKHERYVTAYAAVHTLHANGADIADIARTVGMSRRTVYRYLSLDGPPERKRPIRAPRPERRAWETYIVGRWNAGCHNGRRLWREARAAGYKCAERNVARFVAQLRREGPQRHPPSTSSGVVMRVHGPSARHVSLLFLRRSTSLTKAQATYLEHLCQRDAVVETAYTLAQAFAHMMRAREGAHLDTWIESTNERGVPEVRRFALGLMGDLAAVKAGLTLEYSNGQTEGQVNRLKLVKRTMYGRAKFDLLCQRVLHAT